jgi:glycosyltransferase involved in cell wall biosynthesis
MPTLTVITASLDQGRFIRRTIESVLSQGVDLEYLVYDGGSRDETPAVLASYPGRLRWVSEPDRGQSHAINKGLCAARGDVIGWLNSDDVYTPGALVAVLAAFAAHPEAEVIYGDARYIDEHDADLRRYPVEPWSAARLREECILAQPAVFIRRRTIERVGLLDERLHFAMDYDYWLRLATAGARFRYLRRPLALCRVHPAAKTVLGGPRQARELFDVQRRATGRVSAGAVRHYVRTLVAARGLPAREHPISHRLVAAPLAQLMTLRYAPRSFGPLVRWQLGWPLRFVRSRVRPPVAR